MSINQLNDNTDRQNIYAREDKTDTLASSVVKPPAEILLQSNTTDEALTFARQLRQRFADCRLTYHATDGRLRGRLPYWWALV